MCDSCRALQEAVARAEREGDAEKARIMRRLLDDHRANTCGARHVRLPPQPWKEYARGKR